MPNWFCFVLLFTVPGLLSSSALAASTYITPVDMRSAAGFVVLGGSAIINNVRNFARPVLCLLFSMRVCFPGRFLRQGRHRLLRWHYCALHTT